MTFQFGDDFLDTAPKVQSMSENSQRRLLVIVKCVCQQLPVIGAHRIWGFLAHGFFFFFTITCLKMFGFNS